jgi:peptidoglycan/LPS O-acetylase OafA/YrhL
MTTASYRNNFGLLRLTFALCVLISHSFELVDGDRSREPLTYMFGTISLGELGVAGFFLISGFLITVSFENSSSLLSYFWKRILRIYPAFIVVFILSIAIIAPLSGADMAALKGVGWIKQIADMMLLNTPTLPAAFADLHYRSLNGSMWTIPYEFRCYTLIALLGTLGLLQRARIFALLFIVILLVSAFFPFGKRAPLVHLIGLPQFTLKLTVLFLSGSAFHIFRNSIKYRGDIAFVAGIALIGSLFNHVAEELAVPTFGGYLVFWFAFLKNTPWLNSINNRTDISYGMYLYAWPVQSLLIEFVPGISPLPIIMVATVATTILAFLSWHLIEKPSLSFKSAVGVKQQDSNLAIDPAGRQLNAPEQHP